MRIAELIAPRRFRLGEAAVPRPGPGEVLVRVEAVGICGSDLHAWSEGAVGDTPCRFPQVMGHEPAGTVVEAGAGVTGWSPGDRAAFEPAIYCYHCEFCRAGLHNVCANIRFMSTPGDPGFFRELAAVPAGNLAPIPAKLSTAEATLFEPLAVALHSLKLAGIRMGETAAVFGAGPIGAMTVACLKLAGAARVWAVEPVAHRREMAGRAGADAALDPRAVDPVAEILRDTANRGVDVAIDCAAKDDTVNQCIRLVRSAGRVILTGIPSGVRTPVEFSHLRRKEAALLNARRSNHDNDEAFRLLVEHGACFTSLVTHTRPLDCIAEAFDITERYADGVGKMIVTP